MPKRKANKGYAVAVLIGLEDKIATIWQLFSRKFVQLGVVNRGSTHQHSDPYYSYFETIVDALRPLVKSGLRSVLLVIQPKDTIGATFLNHLNAHHGWLVKKKSANKIVFGTFSGVARIRDDIDLLMQNEEFTESMAQLTGEEGDRIVELFNKRFNSPDSDVQLLYKIEDIENLFRNDVLGEDLRPEYLLFSAEYYSKQKGNPRIQRITDLAKNNKFKVRIMDNENPAGEKIAQFGGIVCLIEKKKKIE